MRILLVDDEPLARQELRYLIDELRPGNEFFEASNIKTAQNVLLKEAVDVVFLDMNLQNESGLELMDGISFMSQPPLVVFATAYDDYAVKAFELNAADYILKPFESDRIKMVMDRVEAKLAVEQPRQGEPDKKYLPVEEDDRIVMVPISDIFVVTTEDGELLIKTRSKEYRMKDSLKAMKEKLPAKLFMQIHRAYIINRDEIDEIQPWFNRNYQVTMNNGLKVIVSRSFMQDFKEAFGLD